MGFKRDANDDRLYTICLSGDQTFKEICGGFVTHAKASNIFGLTSGQKLRLSFSLEVEGEQPDFDSTPNAENMHTVLDCSQC